MAKAAATQPKVRRSRARSPEERELQMISLATDLAEKQMRDGTASPSVISHYLKLGTERYKKENVKLDHEITHLRVKSEQIEAQKRSEDMFKKAMDAFALYSGENYEEYDED